MNDAAAMLGPVERLHPVSLLSSLAQSARGMWGLFAAGGYFAIQGHWFLLVVTFAVYTAVSLASAVLRWKNFSFSVGEREIRIDSGLMNRTHRSLPFDRIQDVTIEQNPLWRALGMARVRFETGGSAGAGEDDGALAAIPLRRAAEIRDLVRSSKGLTIAATVTPDGGTEGAPVFAMDLKRVLLAGLFNFSLAVIGGLVGLTQTFGDTLGFDPFEREFWDRIFGAGTPLGDFFLAHQVMTILAGVVTLVAIGLGTGLIRTLLREYGFRLERTAIGLRRRRGLLTLTDVVLPAKRTQAAVIATGPLRERYGWFQLKLQSLAKEDGGKGDHVVAPLADAEEIETVLGSIGWAPPQAQQWHRVSPAYVTAFALALAPFVLLAVLQVAAFGWIGTEFGVASLSGSFLGALVLLAMLLVLILVRWLAWRRYAYVIDGDRLLVRSGWWRRRLKVLPMRNVQSVDYLQIFIDRWFGTASLVIGVAGGGLAGHGIKALPIKTARDIRTQLLSGFQ